jgi:hypothetical protein
MLVWLAGEAVQLPPTSSLRMPPLKSGSSTERHDSVGGVTGGSQVYICTFTTDNPTLILISSYILFLFILDLFIYYYYYDSIMIIISSSSL